MFDFYKTAFKLGYLSESDVHAAASWGVISLTEYGMITGNEYVAG